MDAELAPPEAPEAPPAPTATYWQATVVLAMTSALLAVWWIAECFNRKSRRWERLGPLLGMLGTALLTVVAYLLWHRRPNWR
jgi:hypothetical protein